MKAVRNRSRRSAGRAAVRLGAGLCMVLMVGTPGLPSGGGTARAQELEGERGPMPTLEITPGGVTAFKAAVLRFQMVGPPVGEERVETLREEIERALVFSGVVVPLDHAAYLGPDQSPPLEGEERLDCESWRSSGADSVVQGEVRREGERLRADLRMPRNSITATASSTRSSGSGSSTAGSITEGSKDLRRSSIATCNRRPASPKRSLKAGAKGSSSRS